MGIKQIAFTAGIAFAVMVLVNKVPRLKAIVG